MRGARGGAGWGARGAGGGEGSDLQGVEEDGEEEQWRRVRRVEVRLAPRGVEQSLEAGERVGGAARAAGGGEQHERGREPVPQPVLDRALARGQQLLERSLGLGRGEEGVDEAEVLVHPGAVPPVLALRGDDLARQRRGGGGGGGALGDEVEQLPPALGRRRARLESGLRRREAHHAEGGGQVRAAAAPVHARPQRHGAAAFERHGRVGPRVGCAAARRRERRPGRGGRGSVGAREATCPRRRC